MTASARQVNPALEYARLAAWSAVGAALLAGLSYFPAATIWGEQVGRAVVLAWGVSLAGSWLASLAPALGMRQSPTVLASTILAGLGVRFVATIALALLARASQLVPGDALMISVGVTQFALLAIDVWALIRLARRHEGTYA